MNGVHRTTWQWKTFIFFFLVWFLLCHGRAHGLRSLSRCQSRDFLEPSLWVRLRFVFISKTIWYSLDNMDRPISLGKAKICFHFGNKFYTFWITWMEPSAICSFHLASIQIHTLLIVCIICTYQIAFKLDICSTFWFYLQFLIAFIFKHCWFVFNFQNYGADKEGKQHSSGILKRFVLDPNWFWDFPYYF